MSSVRRIVGDKEMAQRRVAVKQARARLAWQTYRAHRERAEQALIGLEDGRRLFHPRHLVELHRRCRAAIHRNRAIAAAHEVMGTDGDVEAQARAEAAAWGDVRHDEVLDGIAYYRAQGMALGWSLGETRHQTRHHEALDGNPSTSSRPPPSVGSYTGFDLYRADDDTADDGYPGRGLLPSLRLAYRRLCNRMGW